MKATILMMLLSISTPSFAALLFVAPEGDDIIGTGSIEMPFASLEKACEYVTAGDTVFMRGGIYGNEAQRINHETDGTGENPIVFMAYPGEAPLIDGTDINLVDNGSLLYIARWNGNPTMRHIVIDGLTVRNSNERGIGYYKTDHLTIKNCLVYNTQERGIGGFGQYTFIDHNEVHHAGLVNENGVLGNGGWPMVIHAVVDWETGVQSSHTFITNNFIHASWGEGIGPGVDAIVEGNTIKDVWSVGIYCDKSADVIIRNNHIYNIDTTFYRFDEPAVGISMANETSFLGQYEPVQGISIYNNLVSNTRYGIGFWFDSDNNAFENTYSDIFIAHNIIYNPTTSGISMDDVPDENNQPYDCRMHNNIIGFGDWQSEIHDSNGWEISHNNWEEEIPDFAGNYSLSVDPLFENPGIANSAEGYQLTGGSMCVGAGTELEEVNHDFFGNPYQSPPSLGIHSFCFTPVRGFSEIAKASLNPNPAKDRITIEMTTINPLFFNVGLYDITGTLVVNKYFSGSTYEMDVSHLTKGSYIIIIQNNNYRFSQSVILQ